MSGWQVEGDRPAGLQQAVLVGAPHTSNWDLFYTLGLMYTLNLKFRFLIKSEALVFPFTSILHAMGAFPVERKRLGANSVEQIAKVFEDGQECFLCIAPEGTRKPVQTWKTGFYHIARAAKVPILVGFLDCQQKKVHIGDIIDSALSEAEVMGRLKVLLEKAHAKKPENFVLPQTF